MEKRWIVALILVGAMALSACGGGESNSAQAPAATATVAVATAVSAEATATTAVATATAVAVEPDTQVTATVPLTATATFTATTAKELSSPNALKASDLIGYSVKNPSGDDWGKVSDALVVLKTGEVRYVIMSGGGLLGVIGNKSIPVPWNALKLDALNDMLVVDRQMPGLQGVPAFANDAWPDFTDQNWDEKIQAYWQTLVNQAQNPANTPVTSTSPVTVPAVVSPTASMTTTGEMTATSQMTATGNQQQMQVKAPYVARLSNLMDFKVKNRQGEDLGSIEDMVISWNDGSIKYVVLSFGGILGVGDKWFAVPWNQLTLDALGQTYVIDVNKETLQNAPGFDKNNWPDISSPNWDQQIREFWKIGS